MHEKTCGISVFVRNISEYMSRQMDSAGILNPIINFQMPFNAGFAIL